MIDLENIAKNKLSVDTLEERGWDRLDFPEVYCENLLEALIESFKLGSGGMITEEHIKGLNTYLSMRLGRKTMYSQNSDGLDFFEISVWGIREYLEYAYSEGKYNYN